MASNYPIQFFKKQRVITEHGLLRQTKAANLVKVSLHWLYLMFFKASTGGATVLFITKVVIKTLVIKTLVILLLIRDSIHNLSKGDTSHKTYLS